MKKEFQNHIITKRRNEHRLLSNPNVSGVGVGSKITAGKDTGEPAIRVYVMQKYSPELQGPNEIPKEIDGLKTDVIQLKIKTFAGGYSASEKVRPLAGGCSIGSALYPVGGTLATVVRDIEVPSMKFGLSCYHVLCPTNQPVENEDIVQPSTKDGGKPTDVVGKLGWQTLMDGIDCGLIELQADDNLQVGKVGDIQLNGVGTYDPDRVYKCGKQSKITEGVILDYDLTFDVQYEFGLVYRHHHLFLIGSTNDEPFAVKGDSGAIVYDDEQHAFGIVIGGDASAKLAAATWIQPVLDHLNVSLT